MKTSTDEILPTNQSVCKFPSPQCQVPLGTRERLELAKEDLVKIQDFLLELGESDPGYYGRLIVPASRLYRAAKELEAFISPSWSKVRRWNDQ